MKEKNLQKKAVSFFSFILMVLFLVLPSSSQQISETNEELPVSPLLANKYDLEYKLDLSKGLVYSE